MSVVIYCCYYFIYYYKCVIFREVLEQQDETSTVNLSDHRGTKDLQVEYIMICRVLNHVSPKDMLTS